MSKVPQNRMQCPCCSGRTYASCCQKYHQGLVPENALVLMRSRYCAFALGDALYLVRSTHPSSPHFVDDQRQWLHQLKVFSNQVDFNGLEVVESQLGSEESFVFFVAYLSKENTDLTFSERSRFIKDHMVWKYFDGQIAKGKLTAHEIKQLSS